LHEYSLYYNTAFLGLNIQAPDIIGFSRNPQTGAVIKIKASKSPKFKPGRRSRTLYYKLVYGEKAGRMKIRPFVQ
jgi:hypothetical protein